MEEFIKNLLYCYVPVSIDTDIPFNHLDPESVESIALNIYKRFDISINNTIDFIKNHGLYYPRMIKFIKDYVGGF